VANEGNVVKGDLMDSLDEDAAREVAAFVERFNYFRKPYNQVDIAGSSWVRNHGLAGDAVVYRAITGHGDIGLLMNRKPRFICFDVDLLGKGGDEPEPVGIEEDGEEEQQEQTVEREAWDEAGPFTQDPRTWAGWAEIGIGGEVEEELERGLRESVKPMVPSRRIKPELEPKTRQAVEALVECFTERPSLVVKSPHGAHVYWCLEEEALWYQLRLKLGKVKRAWEEKKRERGIGRKLEVLPTPLRPLRIPRLDRLLEPDGLEPMGRPADGEAFWRGLSVYRLDGLIKDEVLERVWPKEERPGQRLQEGEVGDGSGGRKGKTDAEILSLRPRNSREAEAMLMPFRDCESNVRLIKMIEGGKRGGMTLDDVTEWVFGWETRSRAAGYSGDMFRNQRELRSRIESLYATCNVTEAGATRFVKIWREKEGKYPRNREAAERMLEQLESVSPQPRQSRQAVLRFLENLGAWRMIIDDAVADPASGIDDLTRRNQGRGAYPLPTKLCEEWYSGYKRIGSQVQAAGIIIKDEEPGGGYVPDIGRPQYYRLNIMESDV
jgi:hypothetical protein